MRKTLYTFKKKVIKVGPQVITTARQDSVSLHIADGIESQSDSVTFVTLASE